jgi:hypothetical protein
MEDVRWCLARVAAPVGRGWSCSVRWSVDRRPVALVTSDRALLALIGGCVVCYDRLTAELWGEKFVCVAVRWPRSIASAASAVHSPFVVL